MSLAESIEKNASALTIDGIRTRWDLSSKPLYNPREGCFYLKKNFTNELSKMKIINNSSFTIYINTIIFNSCSYKSIT
jgi:hypothetical protein